jgi:hypothetical protein
MPELDQYEKEGIASDADVESLSENAAEEARQAAERELERRDKREAGELPMAFQSGAQQLPLHLPPSTILRSYDLHIAFLSDANIAGCTCFLHWTRNHKSGPGSMWVDCGMDMRLQCRLLQTILQGSSHRTA